MAFGASFLNFTFANNAPNQFKMVWTQTVLDEFFDVPPLVQQLLAQEPVVDNADAESGSYSGSDAYSYSTGTDDSDEESLLLPGENATHRNEISEPFRRYVYDERTPWETLFSDVLEQSYTDDGDDHGYDDAPHGPGCLSGAEESERGDAEGDEGDYSSEEEMSDAEELAQQFIADSEMRGQARAVSEDGQSVSIKSEYSEYVAWGAHINRVVDIRIPRHAHPNTTHRVPPTKNHQKMTSFGPNKWR